MNSHSPCWKKISHCAIKFEASEENGITCTCNEVYYDCIRKRQVINLNNSTGPFTWPTVYPDSCSYNSQSPINVATADVTTDYSLDQIIFSASNPDGTTHILSNNGHSGKNLEISLCFLKPVLEIVKWLLSFSLGAVN